jgi:nicotinic acid mononucleotide adenylyltransferase
MARIAAEDYDWLEVSDWEATRTQYSRSVEVARYVEESQGLGVTVVFVCGADVLKSMVERAVWTDESIRALLSHVVLAVAPRPGVSHADLLADSVFSGHSDRVWELEGAISVLSSTEVRCVQNLGV